MAAAQSGRFCKSLRSEGIGIECAIEPERLASIAETRLGLLALWMLMATLTWLCGLYAMVYFTMHLSEHHYTRCRCDRRRAGLCILGYLTLYVSGLLLMLSLYIFNADRVPPELQVVDPMDIDPPYGMDFQLESLGAWTNMSKVSQLRMEYVRGPGVPYWEYTDIASILFGCLVLLLPLMAYVMGDDGDEDD